MDWNEDGLKDLIVGETNGQVRYYRNIGSVGSPVLTFDSYIQVAGSNIDVGDYSYPSVDDWNEDGLKDLIVGGSSGKAHLYINNGTNEDPRFTEEDFIIYAGGQQVQFISRTAPFVADLDGDDVKDLVVGEVHGYAYFCKNNGTNEAPQLADSVRLKTGTVDIYNYTSRITTTDWDGNGQLDLMVGGWDCRLMRYMRAATTPERPEITLTNNGGWIIPNSGGRLDYTIEVINNTTSTQVCDVWTDAMLPSHSIYGPILLRTDVSLDPLSSLSRDLIQDVPGSAPSGGYYYYAYAGDHTSLQVYSKGEFHFNKSYIDDGGSQIGTWNISGWDDCCAQELLVPESHALLSAYPNPFNPITTIGFALPIAEKVNLVVYDLAGRQVARLVDGWRDAGYHQVTFDATSFASGIYLYRLSAGSFHASGKMVLMK